jgi:aminoglycoside/choline kinase family phosphotransferase/dTDP-glucose pyrophosphorylase
MKALVLAAGFGTRLRPYTLHTPKPLFTVAGRPLLDIWLRSLIDAGCEAIAVNTHHRHAAIAAYLDARNYPVPVILRHEPEILGTGGAIKNLGDFWDEQPFFVVNSDVLTDIDLGAFQAFHERHSAPASLVLADDPSINTVVLGQSGEVLGFDPEHRPADSRLRTFTGVQILDPVVLDFIPDKRFYSSIDAFREMMASGHSIRAFLPENLRWRDLGTPERYRNAVFDAVATAALNALSPNRPVSEFASAPLAGDGSARRWYRVTAEDRSAILVDHGIRQTPESVEEVDAFIAIGRHLKKAGAPAPEILAADAFAGLVAVSDLGDTHLRDLVHDSVNLRIRPEARSLPSSPPLAKGDSGGFDRFTNLNRTDPVHAHTGDWTAVIPLYKTVIDRLVHMSRAGAEGFDPAWAYETASYDRYVILERECRYFVDAFANGYLGAVVDFEECLPDFEAVAEGALAHAVWGFMHRDFQSANIMVKDGEPFFIDFQGGRMGPIQYDLASLLIDPYVAMPRSVQSHLLNHCIDVLGREIPVDRSAFLHSFHYCALSRNLQILGAYGHLTVVQGKTRFAEFIPHAFERLCQRLSQPFFRHLTGLAGMAGRLNLRMADEMRRT